MSTPDDAPPPTLGQMTLSATAGSSVWGGRDLTRPTQPSRAVQVRMAEESEARRRSSGPAIGLSESDGAPENIRRAVAGVVEKLATEIVALSHEIHSHPEVGYTEFHAVATVATALRAHGIEPEVGVFGMETALRAVLEPADDRAPSTGQTTGARTESHAAHALDGTGVTTVPTAAILAEYDALPGIGHGCGHNVMCANSVGAFIALAELERARPGSLPGRVILQTTPAEESSTAKEILAQRGALEGVDVAMQTHSYNSDVTHQTWLGVRRLRVVYTGIAAHASSQPFMGRNALDAATLALTGIGLLRQHILPMDRLHAVITDGGQVPNIVPERAEINVYVRSKYPETLKDLVARIEDLFTGAALMSGTGVEIIADSMTNEMPVRDNGPLLESWTRAQRERDREPLPAGVISETIAAGTDFGNVSVRVPGIHPLIKVAPADVALHTREMTAAAGGPGGDRAAVDGAYGLACVALDYLWDASLRARVRGDFEAQGGVIDVAHFWSEKTA